MGEGFSKFLKTELVTKILDDVVAGELKDGNSDPYDSHPPLRERIAALENLNDAATELDARPSIELVANAEELERDSLKAKLRVAVTPITWEEVGALWIEKWRKTATQLARGAGTLTIATVPSEHRALRSLCEDVEGPQTACQIPDERIRDWAQTVIGVSLCVVLIDAGFTIDTDVGAAVNAVRGDQSIEPIVELQVSAGRAIGRDLARALGGPRPCGPPPRGLTSAACVASSRLFSSSRSPPPAARSGRSRRCAKPTGSPARPP